MLYSPIFMGPLVSPRRGSKKKLDRKKGLSQNFKGEQAGYEQGLWKPLGFP